MRIRLRTVLMESTAGLVLLAAAGVALFAPARVAAELGESGQTLVRLFMAAWPLPFLAHTLHARPHLRRAIMIIIAAMYIAIGVSSYLADGAESLPIIGSFALLVLLAGILPEPEDKRKDDTESLDLFIIGACAGIIIYGLAGIVLHATALFGSTDSTPASLPDVAGAGFIMTGGFLGLIAEVRGWKRWRGAAAFIAVGAAFLLAASLRHAEQLYFSASGFAVVSGVLSYHAVRRVTARSGEIDVVAPAASIAGRFNEAAFWLAMAAAGLYASYSANTDRVAFLASASLAIIGVMAVKSVWARQRPESAGAIGAIMTISVSFAAMIRATGGLESPMIYLAFAGVFAIAQAVSVRFIRVIMLLYVVYFMLEAGLAFMYGIEDAGELLVRAILLSAATVFTGVFAAITMRRNTESLAELKQSKAKLEEMLTRSIEAKEREARRTEELKQVNAESVEMRSALMNVLEDVEESKKVTERDNRRDEAIFFSIAEGLVAASRDRGIFLFNPAAIEATGYEREEAIGKPIDTVFKLMAEDAEVLDTSALNDAFSGKGGKLPTKMTLLRKDGHRVPVEGAVAPFFDERGDLLGIVIAFRDVTVEREIDKQKSGFISIASHQLRTPLSGIRWFLDLLLGGDAGALKPQQKEFLNDIYVSTTRMINLVNDLLNVSRLEQGRVLLNPVELDLDEILETIEKDHVALLKKKNLKFTRSVDKDLPKVTADRNAIHQSLANLVANAINYTPDGGKISVRASKDGKNVIVEVHDTGIGIPKNQQHRLFERFFRADNAVQRETVGSGLGLHITKSMIESAGGSVRFESEEGKGTTFIVTLPGSASKGTLSS